jgi:hypothetical protein
VFQLSSAARTFNVAVSRVNGGTRLEAGIAAIL